MEGRPGMYLCYPGKGQNIFFNLLSPALYGLLFPGLGTQTSVLGFQVMGSVGFGNPAGGHLPPFDEIFLWFHAIDLNVFWK